MSDFGILCPIENWLTDDTIDPDLQGPIAKARAEFSGQSEGQVTALWQRLEIILHDWQTSNGQALPTYRATYRREGEVVVYDGLGRGDVKPDYVAAVWRLAGQEHPPLVRYLTTLTKNMRVALLKVLALLILREAADGNPRGALKASGLFDQVFAELRPMTDRGLRIHKGRRLGGKKTAAENAAGIKDRDQKILAAAMQLLAGHRYGRRDIASLLARRFDMNVRTIRRILKTARV